MQLGYGINQTGFILIRDLTGDLGKVLVYLLLLGDKFQLVDDAAVRHDECFVLDSAGTLLGEVEELVFRHLQVLTVKYMQPVAPVDSVEEGGGLMQQVNVYEAFDVL